jgi:pSer/pThr/pTyr-binding forkhead associated (FHA) protein
VLCSKCGRQNPEDSRYCAQCGSPLPRGGDERPAEQTSTISLSPLETEHHDDDHGGELGAAADALPAGTALLVVKRGPNAGSRFLLDKDMTTAGRHPESDIFLDDVTVSRRHAEFRRTGGGYEVRDVGSLNGTYLNRERIDATELAGGDEVQIGKFRLVYLTGPSADAGAAQ